MLLTATAETYLAVRGFKIVPREEVLAALHTTAEFKGTCPASAVAMLSRP